MRPGTLSIAITMSALVAWPAMAQVVSLIGAGPVQLGMSAAAAQRAMGARFAPVALPFSRDCWITGRADGKDAAISYVIEHGKIVRIDFFPRNGQQVTLKTAAGIGIGSTDADIRRAYKEVSVTRAPYEDEESEIENAKTRARLGITAPQPSPHFWLRVDGPDHDRGIIFVTQDGKVTSFFIGFRNAIEAVENCV